MVRDGHGDNRHGRNDLWPWTGLLADAPKPPDDECRQWQSQVLVCERRAPEQEQRIGGIDEAGAGGRTSGSGGSLGNQEEAGRNENPRRSYDQDARYEWTEAGEIR